MDWALLPLRRYADFEGRSRRKEYWMFALLLIGVFVILSMLNAIVFGTSDSRFLGGVSLLLYSIATLAIIVPSIAVQVRRFHDQDKSGWFVLLNFIPYIGSLIVLVFMCLEGTRGPNRYGADPKMLSGAVAY